MSPFLSFCLRDARSYIIPCSPSPCIRGQVVGGVSGLLGAEAKFMTQKDPIEFARFLRRTSNAYEQLLWEMLRNRQRCKMKFRRQHPLGKYTADFFCAEAKLVVEIDGTHHFTEQGQRHDAIRDQWMNQFSPALGLDLLGEIDSSCFDKNVLSTSCGLTAHHKDAFVKAYGRSSRFHRVRFG